MCRCVTEPAVDEIAYADTAPDKFWSLWRRRRQQQQQQQPSLKSSITSVVLSVRRTTSRKWKSLEQIRFSYKYTLVMVYDTVGGVPDDRRFSTMAPH